jgi:hypothetical protein
MVWTGSTQEPHVDAGTRVPKFNLNITRIARSLGMTTLDRQPAAACAAIQCLYTWVPNAQGLAQLADGNVPARLCKRAKAVIELAQKLVVSKLFGGSTRDARCCPWLRGHSVVA